MHRLFCLLLAVCVVACAPPSEPVTASATKARDQGGNWRHGAMVSAANPDAVDAAIAVLKQGGHAVDAAIAAHAVLGLVEPESSGIGGSAFMLVYNRASDELLVFDGRETAPSGASAELFLRDGQPLGFRDMWALGITVGVPGAVSVYEAAHKRFGRTEWSDLFQPAIRLASNGFEVTPKMVRYNDNLAPLLATGDFPNATEYLFPGGTAIKAGDKKKNPDYAESMQIIASGGAEAFYKGAIARAITARAQATPAPGSLTESDMASYRTVTRDGICGEFRDNRICSVPPPSSGIAQIMIPALYDELLDGTESSIEDKVQVFVDAQRLAYADRDHFVGDPEFTDVPVTELLNPQYIRHRATQRFAPADAPTHGDPWIATSGDPASHLGPDATSEAAGTTHLAIIDREGNAVSMTASVGFPYGSVRMTSGFFLNNELTDFSRSPAGQAVHPANAIAPGKRPRSSMSPVVMFDSDGEPLMLTGSAGGSSILAYSTKTILGVFDWGLSAQQAADFPNVVARGATVGIEVSAGNGQAIADALTERGYNVTPGRGENSGLHVIVVRANGMDGAADSRRHGIVRSLPE